MTLQIYKYLYNLSQVEYNYFCTHFNFFPLVPTELSLQSSEIQQDTFISKFKFDLKHLAFRSSSPKCCIKSSFLNCQNSLIDKHNTLSWNNCTCTLYLVQLETFNLNKRFVYLSYVHKPQLNALKVYFSIFILLLKKITNILLGCKSRLSTSKKRKQTKVEDMLIFNQES